MKSRNWYSQSQREWKFWTEYNQLISKVEITAQVGILWNILLPARPTCISNESKSRKRFWFLLASLRRASGLPSDGSVHYGAVHQINQKTRNLNN